MNFRSNTNVAVVTLVLCGACATADGTKPHDMTTTQHEAAAERERVAAKQHEGQYKAGAKEASMECGGDSFCWTWTMSRANRHKAEMAEHRKLAEKHRGAAQALRNAEATECVGISDSDRDLSPFFHREDIISVGRMAQGGRTVFRSVPGLTAERLQHLVDCHIARAVAAGNNMPEMPYCPLMLKNVSATVSSTSDGFAVEVIADDGAIADQVWSRMQALVAGRSDSSPLQPTQ